MCKRAFKKNVKNDLSCSKANFGYSNIVASMFQVANNFFFQIIYSRFFLKESIVFSRIKSYDLCIK